MQVHEGFGKWAAWFGKSRQLAAAANQTSKSATGFVFQNTSNSSGEATSSGTLAGGKKAFWMMRWRHGWTVLDSVYPAVIMAPKWRGGGFRVSAPCTVILPAFRKVKRGWGMSWNKRRWQWRQQEGLCSGFTVLPRQTLSVEPRRNSYSGQADNLWNTSPDWCSALAAGWVNNMLIHAPLNININPLCDKKLEESPELMQHSFIDQGFIFTILIEIMAEQRLMLDVHTTRSFLLVWKFRVNTDSKDTKAQGSFMLQASSPFQVTSPWWKQRSPSCLHMPSACGQARLITKTRCDFDTLLIWTCWASTT